MIITEPPRVKDVLEQVDPRLKDRVYVDFLLLAITIPSPLGPRVALVGHRGAGKSTLLPYVAKLLKRKPLDLDAEIERALGRPIREVFQEDERRFREVEREQYQKAPAGTVIAAGGGFWANHRDLLGEDTWVEVPVSFETYRERLLADTTRPRLRPELSAEEEIRAVYKEREAIHREHRVEHLVDDQVISLAQLVANAQSFWRPRRRQGERRRPR